MLPHCHQHSGWWDSSSCRCYFSRGCGGRPPGGAVSTGRSRGGGRNHTPSGRILISQSSAWTRWWHREQSSTPLDRSVGSSRPTTSTNGNTAGLCGHLGRDDPRAAEDAAAGVEIVGDDRDVLHRATEAIELPDGEDVARPKDRHHGVESGPVGATCGDMLLEDLRAAGAAEGVETRSQPTPRRPSSSNCVWMTDATADRSTACGSPTPSTVGTTRRCSTPERDREPARTMRTLTRRACKSRAGEHSHHGRVPLGPNC